jgi:hypothetical protein
VSLLNNLSMKDIKVVRVDRVVVGVLDGSSIALLREVDHLASVLYHIRIVSENKKLRIGIQSQRTLTYLCDNVVRRR